jgi:hypothetical protein
MPLQRRLVKSPRVLRLISRRSHHIEVRKKSHQTCSGTRRRRCASGSGMLSEHASIRVARLSNDGIMLAAEKLLGKRAHGDLLCSRRLTRPDREFDYGP